MKNKQYIKTIKTIKERMQKVNLSNDLDYNFNMLLMCLTEYYFICENRCDLNDDIQHILELQLKGDE